MIFLVQITLLIAFTLFILLLIRKQSKRQVLDIGLSMHSLIRGYYAKNSTVSVHPRDWPIQFEGVRLVDDAGRVDTALYVNEADCPGDEFERAQAVLTREGIGFEVLPLTSPDAAQPARRILIRCDDRLSCLTSAAIYLLMDAFRLPYTAKLRVAFRRLDDEEQAVARRHLGLRQQALL